MVKLLTHLDLFSGYGGFSIALERAGFRTASFAEIEPFPCAILKHHWHDVPNLGDVTNARFIRKARAAGPFDIITFGSPCQGFSVAGQRLGLDDPRSNLALHALRIVQKLKPRWFIFENVPGLRSSANGDDFGVFLRLVDECGYSGAWRSLDAQYAGVPQRRSRIFFVGHLGADWRPSAAILFESESMRRYFAPRREEGQGTTAAIAPSLTNSGRGVERAGDSRGQIAHTFRADGFDASEDGTGRGTPLTIAFDLRGRDGGSMPEGAHDTANIRASSGGSSRSYLAFSAKDHGTDAGDIAPTLRAGGHTKSHANAGVMPAVTMPIGIRRLTPLEAERLQGLPDGWTNISYRSKPAADGPRYKCIGNGVAIPVVEWIAQRIARYMKGIRK